MCMAIYAYKCDVPKAQLRKDMQIAFEDLQMVQHENALTEDDIKSALEAYDREYYNFTISDIEALTDVHIERNRRNGLTQEKHLYLARRRKEDMKAIGIPMKAADGRPTAQMKVYEWRKANPSGKKLIAIKTLGWIQRRSESGGKQNNVYTLRKVYTLYKIFTIYRFMTKLLGDCFSKGRYFFDVSVSPEMKRESVLRMSR